MKIKITWLILSLLIGASVQAKENINQQARHSGIQILSNCNPSTSTADLDIGNVRAKILMNGDMWTDLIGNSQYEVPKNSHKYSLFAGALWIGGFDLGHNLKLAAQTYRQSGSDFWPGPMDTSNLTISSTVCAQYDRHWKVTKQEVMAFRDSFLAGTSITPSINIQQWPGNGIAFNNQAHHLAPFVDVNGDGIYNWLDGDYPAYTSPIQLWELPKG